MITADITTKEFYDYLIAHQQELVMKGGKAEFEWVKLVRKNKGKTTSMLLEYECAGNTMYLLCRTRGNSHKGRIHLVLCPVARDKYHYINWTTNGEIFKYTTHFFERFQERMRIKGNMKAVIKAFFNRNSISFEIYRNKFNHVVWAIQDGLLLGMYDEKADMKVACTFVDYSLLKPSQRAAFDIVEKERENLLEYVYKLLDNGLDGKSADIVLSAKFKPLREVAEEIYGMFFESGDLKLRD